MIENNTCTGWWIQQCKSLTKPHKSPRLRSEMRGSMGDGTIYRL